MEEMVLTPELDTPELNTQEFGIDELCPGCGRHALLVLARGSATLIVECDCGRSEALLDDSAPAAA